MKKLTLLTALLAGFFAQGQSAFQKKSKVITISYGVPNIYKRLLRESLEKTDVQEKSLARYYGSTFTYSTSGIGPFFFKYDYAVSDKLGLGFAVGYFNASATETYGYNRVTYNPLIAGNQNNSFYQAITRSCKSLSVGARLNYHFGEGHRVDPYIGFAMGYTHALLEESFETNDPDVSDQEPVVSTLPFPLYLAATVGVRDYFNDNFGVFVELGFDKWALVQAGLAFKLP